MTYRVIGKQVSLSKASNGKPSKKWSTLYLASEFSEYERETSESCEGERLTKESTTLDTTSIKVGSFVELLYSKSATGKAILTGIRTVKPAS